MKDYIALVYMNSIDTGLAIFLEGCKTDDRLTLAQEVIYALLQANRIASEEEVTVSIEDITPAMRAFLELGEFKKQKTFLTYGIQGLFGFFFLNYEKANGGGYILASLDSIFANKKFQMNQSFYEFCKDNPTIITDVEKIFREFAAKRLQMIAAK